MLTGRVGLVRLGGMTAFRSLITPVQVASFPHAEEGTVEEIELSDFAGAPKGNEPDTLGQEVLEEARKEGTDPFSWIPKYLPFLSSTPSSQNLFPFFQLSEDPELQRQKEEAAKLKEQEQELKEKREEKGKGRGPGMTLKHPVVLCHGFMGFDMLGSGFLPQQWQLSYWGSLPSELRELGIPISVTRVPPMSDVKVRAEALFGQLAEQFPGQEINLIGHSMGGLDCRFLASQILGKMEISTRPFGIKSITTLVTPHRGSSFADWLVQKLGVDKALEARLNKIGIDITALSCLTVDYCNNVFNKEVEDVPEILYFSYGAQADPQAVRLTPLIFPYNVIFRAEGPNDGLVSVESSKWGEYQETLDADHLDMIDIKPKFMIKNPAKIRFASEVFEKIFNTLHQHGC